MDLGELVREADLVAVVQSEAGNSHYDGPSRIVTDVTLRVTHRIKGPEQATVVVRCMGGQVDTLAMRVPGEPALPTGKRFLVFLKQTPDGNYRPLGMSQGVMPIHADASGQTMVHPGGQGLGLMQTVQTPHGRSLTPAPAALMYARPLNDVLREISRILKADT